MIADSLFLFSKHFPEQSFFKFPKESKLPKNKSVAKQQDIVKRKDEDPIRNMKPGTTTGIKKKMMDHRLDKHDREACAGKDTENEDHLRDAV